MSQFFLLFSVSVCIVSAHADSSLGEPGTVFTAGQGAQTWLTSSNGNFSAGFTGDSRRPGYLFAVWYQQVVPRTIVWYATSNDTGGAALELQKGDTLVFQSDGRLTLNSAAEGIVWGTSTSTNGVTAATLQDDGNLVLTTKSQLIVWASFDRPADTMLPNQQLGNTVKLVSSNNLYYLSMDTSSRVALFYRGYWVEPFWRIENDNIDQLTMNNPPKLNFSSEGLLSFYDGNGTSWKSSTDVYDTAQRYALDFPVHATRRLKLDNDGNLRIYSLATNGTWTISWQAILLECDIFGKCGRFGICTYRPTATCTCPPGFHPTNGSDMSQDCARNTPLPQCSGNSTAPNSTKAIRLVRTDYQYNDYNSHPFPQPMSEEDCQATCLQDCKCLGAAYQIGGSGMCWLKGLDPSGLYNGKQSLDIKNVFFLKVSARDPAGSPVADEYVTNANATVVPGFQWRLAHVKFFKDSKQVGLLLATILQFVLLAGIVSTVSYRIWIKRIYNRNNTFDFDKSPVRFTYQQLQLYTDNFCEKLGSGGFGTVYKGTLPDGTSIAVKEIEMAMQAEKQFQAEVQTIGQIHHINLVRLLGYCYEDARKLLVYEFMPNSSLEKLLFLEPESYGQDLCSWDSRFSIALGIARGITYLHEECHECILHCDIKPQNILLDADFCPKVSDFGLAKLVQRERALSVSTIRGTRGYLAPEWIRNLPITTKVDVFSFGMVLLELLSGRDKYLLTPSAINSERWYFPDWAYTKYEVQDVHSIADKRLQHVDWIQFWRVLKVAFWCIQYDAEARPSMSKVIQMLEDTKPVPDPPFPTNINNATPSGRSTPFTIDLSSVTGTTFPGPEQQA